MIEKIQPSDVLPFDPGRIGGKDEEFKTPEKDKAKRKECETA
jgi:hypothetical protein